MSIEFTPTGLKITSAEENIKELEGVFKGVFGDEINLAPETPQGQLIASLAAIITDKDAQFLEFVNNINPETADGYMQDALAALYLITRKPATYSSVMLECRGRAGVTIPAASEVKSEGGDLFSTTEARTIPASGVVLIPADAKEAGAIAAPAASITRIVKPLAGWDSVINPEAAIPGAEEESRASFEERRKKSVAGNATGSVGAVYAAVANLDGVTDCVVHENKGDNSYNPNSGSIYINPHSIYVCIAGGDETEIAEAIYAKKSAGCDLNGETEVFVYDKPSGANYLIKFQRPDPVRFKVKVTILGEGAPANYEAMVKKAVDDNFYGRIGIQEKVRIGSTVYASRFYTSLNVITGINAISIKVTAEEGSFVDYVGCEINQIFTLDIDDVSVTTV